jgi:hypothetical protein
LSWISRATLINSFHILTLLLVYLYNRNEYVFYIRSLVNETSTVWAHCDVVIYRRQLLSFTSRKGTTRSEWINELLWSCSGKSLDKRNAH